jgi:hypothetical protein
MSDHCRSMVKGCTVRHTCACDCPDCSEVRKAEEQVELLELKQRHDSGIHLYGYCPYCPPNIFYD